MRLIDAEQLKKAVRENYGGVLDAVLVCRFIDEYAEPVDAEPVKHAHWIDDTFCSACGGFREDDDGHILMPFSDYCPNCGAIMDEVEDES